MMSGGPPKPRYQTASKYTQRSRQARRMDPATYTTHIDGRAAEFDGGGAEEVPSSSSRPYSGLSPRSFGGTPPSRGTSAAAAAAAAAVASEVAMAAAAAAAAAAPGGTARPPPAAAAAAAGGFGGAGPAMPGGSSIRNPMWLQKKMDIAQEWERQHVPPKGPEDEYKWRRASTDLLRSMRERRQTQEATVC